MLRWRVVVAPVCAALVVLSASACTDGTPAFCSSLRSNADLGELSDALDAGDLEVAGAEARRLRDLADEAPSAVRADLRELADSVVEVVALLEDEASGDVDAGDLERRRDQLNDDLAEMDERSQRVTTWALEECGLDLG